MKAVGKLFKKKDKKSSKKKDTKEEADTPQEEAAATEEQPPIDNEPEPEPELQQEESPPPEVVVEEEKEKKPKPGNGDDDDKPSARDAKPKSQKKEKKKKKKEDEPAEEEDDFVKMFASDIPLIKEKDCTSHNTFPRFVLKEYKSGTGSFEFRSRGKEIHKKGKSITKGLQTFKSNPAKYIGMTFQANSKTWPTKEQEYYLIERKGTEQLAPTGVDPQGWMAILIIEYQHLPPFPDNQFPMEFRDQYTDTMTHKGQLLHSDALQPICPGRGMGCADSPLVKIISDIDPSDIHQGQVGCCWLLSAISAIAEFDGAIKRLYRKTPNLHEMPRPGPNTYTITLWDLPTWKEVDIVIDERLAANPNTQYSSSTLLSSKPSEDGELWVCYLEKAIAVHCGGWDAITGGQCVHAWSIMTGCRQQYTILPSYRGTVGKYTCHARYNPHTNKWLPVENDPHKCDNKTGVWPVPFPVVGASTYQGDSNLEMTAEEVFVFMYNCDQLNYIVGAGSKGGGTDDGLVDNHAYTVIEAVQDAAGTGIDLFKVRNPWGKGEIEDGEFDDDGPGWDKYPQIKALLNPVVADDGIFWVTKQEFFDFFGSIYVSASNMTQWKED